MSDIYPVAPGFAARANVDHAAYERACAQALNDPDAFWAGLATRLDWYKAPTQIKDVSYDLKDFRIRWYADGELNASVNCLDRHLEKDGDKVALIFEPDSPDAPVQKLTYRELHARVCRLANALRNLGVGKGDRVTIYLPMIPEAAIAMLACARIGAIHMVVFGGFAPNSIADRVADCTSKLIITADEGLRGGRKVPLKANVDAALKLPGTNSVETVLVVRHTGGAVDMQMPRDRWYDAVVDSQPATCEPERMNAEDPLFILYTSGSTGKPKGVLHTTGGYLLWAAYTHEKVFDLKPYFVPAPSAIAEAFADNIELVTDAALVSGRNALVGLIAGTVLGVASAFVLMRFRVLSEIATPLAFAVTWWTPLAVERPAHRLAAVLAGVVVLWITEAIPMAVTAFVGVAAAVVLGVAPAPEAFAPFADPLIFVFIGTFMLARAIFVHRLDRRFAFAIVGLRGIGEHPGRVLLAYAAVACVISTDSGVDSRSHVPQRTAQPIVDLDQRAVARVRRPGWGRRADQHHPLRRRGA